MRQILSDRVVDVTSSFWSSSSKLIVHGDRALFMVREPLKKDSTFGFAGQMPGVLEHGEQEKVRLVVIASRLTVIITAVSTLLLNRMQ